MTQMLTRLYAGKITKNGKIVDFSPLKTMGYFLFVAHLVAGSSPAGPTNHLPPIPTPNWIGIKVAVFCGF